MRIFSIISILALSSPLFGVEGVQAKKANPLDQPEFMNTTLVERAKSDLRVRQIQYMAEKKKWDIKNSSTPGISASIVQEKK
ncbi:MAG: hypothetical protein HRU19_21545 [Pseudobacteriovorax sp.]|nr:hypothetical protein [Pseudobacteriovorax sp.]